MPELLCENVELFNVKLEEAKVLANGNPIIILLTGAIDPSTGLSWCPDCTNADPVIHDIVITQNPNVVLLTCPVRREDFRKPDYEFRTNEVKLKCVPTLLRWGTKIRLNDSQSQKPEFVRTLLEDASNE